LLIQISVSDPQRNMFIIAFGAIIMYDPEEFLNPLAFFLKNPQDLSRIIAKHCSIDPY
jgi:hypothetical protein